MKNYIEKCLRRNITIEENKSLLTGKNRRVTVASKPKVLWERMVPVLRNPVISKYELAKDVMLKKELELRRYVNILCWKTILTQLMLLQKRI